MYEKFYNLKKEPFHVTPDPQFLYLSESHKQALASIMYGIERRKGFVAITGGVGVGKTTVVRTYLEKATNAGLRLIYVFHANVSFKDLVRTIYQELGLELATTDLAEMVDGLLLALIELYRQGKTVVVIIDEAQNMPLETLENLRMLSNLETPTEKLIQIVLVGQTELDELLQKHELRQLKQRIAIRSHIAPLSAEDSRAYIRHRLSVAGLNDGSIFDKRALDIIIKEGNGVPRRLNILCDNTLITGFGRQKNPVTASIVKEVVADFASPRKEQPRMRRWQIAASVALVFSLALLIAWLVPHRNSWTEKLGTVHLLPTEKPKPVRAWLSLTPSEKAQVASTPTPAAPVQPQPGVEYRPPGKLTEQQTNPEEKDSQAPLSGAHEEKITIAPKLAPAPIAPAEIDKPSPVKPQTKPQPRKSRSTQTKVASRIKEEQLANRYVEDAANFRREGKYTEALKAYQHALQVDPHSQRARDGLEETRKAEEAEGRAKVLER